MRAEFSFPPPRRVVPVGSSLLSPPPRRDVLVRSSFIYPVMHLCARVVYLLSPQADCGRLFLETFISLAPADCGRLFLSPQADCGRLFLDAPGRLWTFIS